MLSMRIGGLDKRLELKERTIPIMSLHVEVQAEKDHCEKAESGRFEEDQWQSFELEEETRHREQEVCPGTARGDEQLGDEVEESVVEVGGSGSSLGSVSCAVGCCSCRGGRYSGFSPGLTSSPPIGSGGDHW